MKESIKVDNLFTMWEKLLYNDYEYLYVYKTDKYFSNFAKDIFEFSVVKEKTLYKIEKTEDGKISLKEIIRKNKNEKNENKNEKSIVEN